MPAPVAPGDEVVVSIDWESRLPRVRRRTGTKGNFIFLSHWFPKLAVYERERGWRAHPFHMNTEFYADYGTYDVTLDLAEEYAGKIAGSGQRVGDPEIASGRVVTRFVAPAPADQEAVDPVAARGSKQSTKVHGFAWTADPDYVVHEEMFRWNEWASRYEDEVDEVKSALGLSTDELRGRDVLVRVMIHPEHAKTRPSATGARQRRRCSSTASGTARIPMQRSPRSILRGAAAQPRAWSTRRCSRAARACSPSPRCTRRSR